MNPLVFPYGDELTQTDINNINAVVANNFPLVTTVRGPTRMYNCHSYAWYSQSATQIWIDPPNQATYWTDGSYPNYSTYPMYLGDKVRYVSDDHSAILYDWYGHYTSKWGAWGLYIHYSSYCPYNASTLYYYRP
jgi:hypothetical protein